MRLEADVKTFLEEKKVKFSNQLPTNYIGLLKEEQVKPGFTTYQSQGPVIE